MTDSPLKIGLAGLGTVGVGVLQLLATNKSLIRERAGRDIVVAGISGLNKSKKRCIDTSEFQWYEDAVKLGREPEIDVILELIGGSDGVALSLVKTAVENKKHVITANKALIAIHGFELATMAEQNRVCINYEAAVAGGIPIIKVLREGLSANEVNSISGILNGTSNYILSTMAESGRGFDEVLEEAQALGYAESDPSFDVDGVDSAHKLAILASLAFGTKIDFQKIYVEGIRQVSPIDVSFARELGYGIKLLAVANKTSKGIDQRVHPCMVPIASPINHVSGVLNGIVIKGNFMGASIHEGSGAGGGPTASSVVADIVDIARNNFIPTFGVKQKDLKPLKSVPMDERVGPYYVRLMVLDQPGVFASVANSLKKHKISMESVLQQTRHPGEPVPVVMIVHDTKELAMKNCLQELALVSTIVEPPILIRIETFG